MSDSLPKFLVNALSKEMKSHPSSAAEEAGRYFYRIYHQEGLLINMTAEDRYKERPVTIKPLLNGLLADLETGKVSIVPPACQDDSIAIQYLIIQQTRSR